MASSTDTTFPFTVGEIVLIRDIVLIVLIRDIVLIDAKESYMTSICGEVHDSFLELNILLGKIV